jgi:hypothetical protein
MQNFIQSSRLFQLLFQLLQSDGRGDVLALDFRRPFGQSPARKKTTDARVLETIILPQENPFDTAQRNYFPGKKRLFFIPMDSIHFSQISCLSGARLLFSLN